MLDAIILLLGFAIVIVPGSSSQVQKREGWLRGES
jgi:hypothetical protein